jgi:hypothetical protein
MNDLIMKLQRQIEALLHAAFPPNCEPYFDRDQLMSKLLLVAHSHALEVIQKALDSFKVVPPPQEHIIRFTDAPDFMKGKIMKMADCPFVHDNISILVGVPEMPISQLPKVCSCGRPLTYAPTVFFAQIGMPESVPGVMEVEEIKVFSTPNGNGDIFPRRGLSKDEAIQAELDRDRNYDPDREDRD